MGTPDLRASDADRERVVTFLREHTVAGRLTLEEFSQRIDQAYAARTLAELEEVGRDLPVTAAPHRRGAARITGVVFGHAQRTGPLRLPRLGFALVLGGDCDLDLRRAELSGPVASITALVLFGNINLYVPEGVDVDVRGLVIFGHRRQWGRDLPVHPGTPLLRIKILSLVGTADVWRVPAKWIGKSFREVIRSLRRGEHRELPPGE